MKGAAAKKAPDKLHSPKKTGRRRRLVADTNVAEFRVESIRPIVGAVAKETTEIMRRPPRATRTTRFARRIALAASGLAALLAADRAAWAESPYCSDLRGQIARAGNNAGAARYRAAAARQQSEINRTAAYARSLGCDREQFLFFGDPPPPQCGSINARLAQMRANLASLQSVAYDGGGRQALIARYEAECRDAHFVTRGSGQPRNLFEELFGVAPPPESGGLREVPVEDDRGALPEEGADDPDGGGDNRIGGSQAICVRACDGGFFPVSYSARRSNLEDLNNLCKALCPGAEATLYTRSPSRELDSAVSIEGESYADHPNAFKFAKSYDASCGCKPPDKSWAEALADAERILAATHSKDEVVTAEQAEAMSRPAAAADLRGKTRQKNFSTRVDAPPVGAGQQPDDAGATATAAKDAAKQPEVFREIVGPDGVKRRVRVVAPTL